jgi:hypothetical protein
MGDGEVLLFRGGEDVAERLALFRLLRRERRGGEGHEMEQ